MKAFLGCILFLTFAQEVWSDCYMHNPRGSNDRNCERNVNRNNGNRLFDSQNNNQGGYACPRAVGAANIQAESGNATFTYYDANTGTTQSFTQAKRMYYYEGSVLPIEWTDQHGCGGNSKVSCEIVMQYACEDTLDPKVDDFWPWVNNKAEVGTTYRGTQHFRSGTNIAAPRDGVPTDSNDAATDTIGNDEQSAIPSTTTTQRYGMHENFDYYTLCSQTERNKGLYTADQQINRNDQRGTRQNPNGNRHGLECGEERDYYPWWHPSPWIDVAVLSDSANDTNICYPTSKSCSTRCAYYMNNTMNWNKKGYCDVDRTATGATVQTKLTNTKWNQNQWYNNRAACEGAGFVWYEVSHADNLNLANNSFVCAKTLFSRVNQLGNGGANTIVSQSQPQSQGTVKSAVVQGVNANRFMWTIPKIPTAKAGQSYFNDMTAAYSSCTLRIRYNVSSADFQAWPKGAVDPSAGKMVDSTNNTVTKNGATDSSNTPITQDPYVTVAPGADSSLGDQFVKLKVNTNQYARTFQDRSYVFSIKPVPTVSSAASDLYDTPAVDASAISTALKNGGKIYNVNVRGKRGNIVQVYPSVEYDFIPNALALSTNDLVHFQWTGSDYNPQRGCNDATGGPPDPNTYSTAANANQNSRADRSNVLLTSHMATNTPKDYLGYDPASTTLAYSDKVAAAQSTVLQHAPCYDNTTDTSDTANACYAALMRLAYLNQQKDQGSLTLRGGAACLTQTQLNAINDQDTSDNHPLNCAKMNAKPHPYFDGGVVAMKKTGWFSYHSSRNNNFSNRQQIGIICVGNGCKVDPLSGELQDTNPNTVYSAVPKPAATNSSACYDTASGKNGANANAAHSCIKANAASANSSILTVETFSKQEGDSDATGSGSEKSCAVLTFSSSSSSSSVEQDVGLSIGLLFVGLFTAWLAYFLYNRYQARKEGEGKFRYDTAWQKAEPVEKKTRPVSNTFSQSNPGVKMGRGGFTRLSQQTPREAEMVGTTSSGGEKLPSATKVKRTEVL